MIKTVADYLEATVRRAPDRIAYADDRRALTFAQLRREARGVAQSLLDRGLFRRPAAIFMDRRVEHAAAMVGVVYSGNFYTSLDAKMPPARIRKILDTLEPAVILTDEEHEETARAFAGEAEVLVYAQAAAREPEEAALAAARDRTLTTDLVFVVFTSGSTGTPKGVAMQHRALLSDLEWGAEKLGIGEDTVLGQMVPLYFISHGFELYHALRAGCAAHILSKETVSFPALLMEALREKRVTMIVLVPSVMCMAANLGALEEMPVDCLKTVIFGGEAMPARQMNMWRRAYPSVDFYNIYGMTETMSDSVYFLVDRDMDENEPVPIGRACEHMEFFLTDEDGRVIPVTEPDTLGELCCRGPGLAAGYFKDPEKTRRVFTPDPESPVPGAVIFHTGDLARYNDRGEIVYAGRKDLQIKHMGNRIELGEIETAAAALDAVDSCGCVHDAPRDRIILFYTGGGEVAEVLSALRHALPDYMVPNKVTRLEAMPLNANGKIDRVSLREMI